MKRCMQVCLALTAASALVALFSCGDDNGISVPLSQHQEIPMQYDVSGNELILYFPAGTETYSDCVGDSLVTYSLPYEAETSSVAFELAGDTLRIIEVDSNYEDYTDPLMVIIYYTNYVRRGTGSGLTGTWRLAGVSYAVTRGSLTSGERTDLDLEIAYANQSVASGAITETLSINASTITYSWSENQAATFADDFIAEWNYYDSADYDITVTRISNSAVRMTGGVSGEVVTLSCNAAGDVTYSSSVATNTPMTDYYGDPLTCPSDVPDWYDLFLEDNSSWLYKRTSATEPSVKHRRPFGLARLMSRHGGR